MSNLFIQLYYLFCIVYAVVVISKKRKNSLINSLIVTFLPLLGFLLTYYIDKTNKPVLHKLVEGNEESSIATRDDVNIYETVDIENEINVVPIQEALLLNNNKVKRKLLIHSLKENSIQNPKVLEKALESEDSETSHYAASAIMEMKRKLLNSIQELEAILKESPEDSDVLTSYADIINQYLKSGFLDEGANKQYQILLSNVLEELLLSGNGQKQHYINKINCDLRLLNYDKALTFSEKFLAEHPNEEMAYIMALKINYTVKNPIQLQKVIKMLKEQPVRLTSHGLSIIRFWL